MSKVRNFAEITPNILFSEFDFYDLYRSTFEKSELGRMKQLLPLRAIADNFGHCMKMHKRMFGVDVKKVGGDAGYARSGHRKSTMTSGESRLGRS